jgi:signal peptidase II
MPGKKREKIIFFLITSSVIFLDQLSKFLVSSGLDLNRSFPLIKGIFHLTLVHNYGAAFGILKNQTLFFIVIAIIISGFIVFKLRSNKKPFLFNLSLCLLLAGAIGNLIDRFFYGYVIDFLDFRVWPVFNIADSAVTIGAVILGIYILRNDLSKKIKKT